MAEEIKQEQTQTQVQAPAPIAAPPSGQAKTVTELESRTPYYEQSLVTSAQDYNIAKREAGKLGIQTPEYLDRSRKERNYKAGKQNYYGDARMMAYMDLNRELAAQNKEIQYQRGVMERPPTAQELARQQDERAELYPIHGYVSPKTGRKWDAVESQWVPVQPTKMSQGIHGPGMTEENFYA